MKKLVTSIAISLFCIQANAETSQQTTISSVQVYPEYGGGDVIFELAVPTSSCQGYWLSPSMPGFQGSLSNILASFHATKTVQVTGKIESEHKWSGSGAHFCKLYTIRSAN